MKYQLKPGFEIFLNTIIFESKVIAQGIGLTDTIHQYCIADSKARAEELARAEYNDKDLEVRIVDAFATTRATVNSLMNKDKVLGWGEGVQHA